MLCFVARPAACLYIVEALVPEPDIGMMGGQRFAEMRWMGARRIIQLSTSPVDHRARGGQVVSCEPRTVYALLHYLGM